MKVRVQDWKDACGDLQRAALALEKRIRPAMQEDEILGMGGALADLAAIDESVRAIRMMMRAVPLPGDKREGT